MAFTGMYLDKGKEWLRKTLGVKTLQEITSDAILGMFRENYK